MIVNLRNDKHCNKSDNPDHCLSCEKEHIILIINLCAVSTTAVKQCAKRGDMCKGIVIICSCFFVHVLLPAACDPEDFTEDQIIVSVKDFFNL